MSEETLTDQLEQLVEMLPEGAEKPVSIADIATRLNTNKRTITAWVAFLINHKGVPMGSRRSAPSGYYLITSDEERNNAIAPLTAQALEELKRAEKLRSIDLHTWRNNFNDNKKAATGVRLNTRSCFVTSLAAESLATQCREHSQKEKEISIHYGTIDKNAQAGRSIG